MKIGCLRTVVHAWILLTSALAWAAEAPLQPPTWPQSLSVVPGERATFGIPNPGVGPIHVNVNWTGSPLTIAATSTSGKVIVPPTELGGPSYSFTLDGLALGGTVKCPLVIVSLQLPTGVAASARAAGKFGVQSAPVDMARFQAQIRPLLARQAARPPAPTPQQSAAQVKAAEAAAEAKNKAMEAQRLSQAQTLMTQARTEIATRRNTLKNMAYPGKVIQARRPPALAGAAKAGALKGTSSTGGVAKSPTPMTPMLRGITPQGGMTGEQVTLVAAGLTQDATEVHFTLAPNVVVQANILSFEAAGDGTVTIKVQVPEKAGLTSPFAGQVAAKAVDRQPIVTTNALSFQFVPVVTPSVIYIDPMEVQPGDLVQLQGNNFAEGDVVHFVIPGLGDCAAVTTTVRAPVLAGAPVPPYVAKEIVNGWVYLSRKVPAGWISSQNAPLIFNPSLPLIQSVPDSAAADTPILIRGVSFGDAPAATGAAAGSGAIAGQTNTGTGQPAGGGSGGGTSSGSAVYLIDDSGKEYAMQVSSWTNTHIVTRTPPLTGFVNPKNCKVYVKNRVGKSDPKPMALKPSLTTTLMLLGDVLAGNEYQFAKRGSADAFSVFPTPAAALWINGFHQAALFAGHKDDDEYFLNRKLRNGWVVDSIDFTPGNARLEESRVGTDSPYVKVHWWCDAPWQTASYTLKIYVKGPKGTMY